MEDEKKTARRRLTLYLILVFAATYAYEILVVIPCATSIDATTAAIGSALAGTVMFLPALSVLLTRLITREGFRDAMIKMKLRGNLRYVALTWVGFPLLIALGALLYFLVFPEQFDPNMGYLTGQAGLREEMKRTVLWQIPLSVLLAPVLNALTCFGEEWGWRGYLLPKMRQSGFGMLPTLLCGGVIWGLWHAPLTVAGHNYGVGYPGYPVLGIAAMCVFCTAVGVVLCYVTLRSGSCLPAVIGHGALNGMTAAASYFTTDGGNPFIGPTVTGILGGSGILVLAVVLTVCLVRQEKCTQEKEK